MNLNLKKESLRKVNETLQSIDRKSNKKIFKISSLNTNIKSLKSDFIQVKEELLKLKKESHITQKLSSRGIVPASLPPIKIIVSDE